MRNSISWSCLSAVFCALPFIVVGLGLCSSAAVLFDAPAAWAQDKKVDLPDDIIPEDEPAAANKPAAKEAKKPSDAKPAAAAEPENGQRSMLVWLYKSLGPMYSIIFLGISISFVAILVMNFLGARRESFMPAALIAQFEEHLNAKKYQEAYELVKSDESFLARVLSVGLSKLSQGYQPAIEAMQEAGEDENMKVEHRLSYLALIGTISPMVGLLGTVDGMVAAFMVIAQSSTSPKPSELADGISMALVTTLVGLYLAIPAIAVYNILRNRFARLVLEVGIASEDLMSRFSCAGKKKKD
jgi:biopolymer transport protein ExbB